MKGASIATSMHRLGRHAEELGGFSKDFCEGVAAFTLKTEFATLRTSARFWPEPVGQAI